MQKCIKTEKKKIYIPYIHVQHCIFCFVIHINKSKLIKFIIIRISHKIYDISYALMYYTIMDGAEATAIITIQNNTRQHTKRIRFLISFIISCRIFFCASFTLVLCRVVIFAYYNYSVPVFLFRICLCLLLLFLKDLSLISPTGAVKAPLLFQKEYNMMKDFFFRFNVY